MNQQIQIKVWRISRWWLLLLLIPLLLVPLHKDIVVKVVGADNAALSNADVTLEYKESHLVYNNEILPVDYRKLQQKTDANGTVLFESLTSSIYSFIFNHLMTFDVIAGDNNCYSAGSPGHYYHYFFSEDTVHLKLETQTVDFSVDVVDYDNGEPLKNAFVEFYYKFGNQTYLDTLHTDANGQVFLTEIPNCAEISSIKGSYPNYNSSTIEDVSISEFIHPNFKHELRLKPIRNCNTRGAEDVENQTYYETKFDMGQSSGSFMFEYYTDTHPDQIEVYDDSGRLFYFNDATNANMKFVILNFNSRFITVKVTGGSNWEYIVNCP